MDLSYVEVINTRLIFVLKNKKYTEIWEKPLGKPLEKYMNLSNNVKIIANFSKYNVSLRHIPTDMFHTLNSIINAPEWLRFFWFFMILTMSTRKVQLFSMGSLLPLDTYSHLYCFRSPLLLILLYLTNCKFIVIGLLIHGADKCIAASMRLKLPKHTLLKSIFLFSFSYQWLRVRVKGIH